MALVRDTDAATQLEYPAGTVLYRTAGSIMNPRISPSGDRVAFVHRPITLDTAGEIAVVDRSGRRSVLTPNFASAEGVAWSPKGDEIWFTAAPAGGRHDLWAVTLGGRRRLVHRQTSGMILGDISAAGQVLLASVEWRQKMVFRGPGDDRERELSWLDWSLPTSLSRDGKLVLFSESGEGASGGMMTFMRETIGSPAVKLGPGAITNLSRDGQFAVTVDPNDTAIMLYPIGAGPTRRLPFKGFTIVYAGMFPDGKRLFFDGHEPSRGRRIYVTDIEGSAPLPITPEGTECMAPMLTPDGKYFFVLQGGRSLLLPVAGGTAEPLGIAPDERVTGWAEDGSTYFVYRRGDSPTRAYRVDRKTGRRDFFAEIGPSDRAGIGRGGTNLELTPDGRSYVYSVIQSLSELHLLTGLR
jgi:hypothetical protein